MAKTKKIISTIAAVVMLFFVGGCVSSMQGPEPSKDLKSDVEKDNLIGRWEVVSDGEIGVFVFTEDKHIYIFKSGDSKKEISERNEANPMYSVDTSVRPHNLDIIVNTYSGEELGRLKWIFEYISHNQIRLRMNFDGIRPSGFVPGDDENTVIITKKAEEYQL